VNQLSQSLTYSEARQRDFLLSVSHDLRTPLTSIRGYAESVADGVATGSDAQHAASVIRAESQRLERLVADLLDLARLGAVDFRVDIGPVDLGAFVDGVAAAWQPRCAAAGVVFQAYRPPGPLAVPTDGVRLRQAVDGLLENALRVVPAGAPIAVEARADAFGRGVVEVRDGGPGLSDADLAVAFEQGALFNRYRGVREVGTGLGLAIVAGIVARLGARIEAGHAPEGGARFTISLSPAQGAGPPGS
jgi:two-component system sensor histidine kinase BaeS